MIVNGSSIASTNNASVGVGATAGVSGGGGQSGIGSGGSGGGGRGPGKRTRKEPVDKSDATAFAASEMNKVNNTLHAFVGGKQRSWILNHNATPTPGGEPVRTTIRSQINPIRRRTTPLNRKPSQSTTTGRNTTNIITIEDRNQGIPLLATVGPGKSPPSSLSPDSRNFGLPPTRTQRLPSANMEAVLPSPAPSDSPSAIDRRDEEGEEGVTSAAAQDTPIGSPTDRVYDSEQDQRHGRTEDGQHVIAAGTRRETQTELSSSITGEKDIQTMSYPENHRLPRGSSKRVFETTEDHVENAKRRKQTSILPISEVNAVLPPAQIPRSGEHGSGTSLNSRVQSPAVDSQQISPVLNQRSSQSPIIPPNSTPVIPSNASSIITPSSQSFSVPLHYSTSLPPTTSSPLTQPPMLGISLPNTISDLNSWNPLALASQPRAQGPASPQFHSQHLNLQQQYLQQQQHLQHHQQQQHQKQLQLQLQREQQQQQIKQRQQQLQQQQLQQQQSQQQQQIQRPHQVLEQQHPAQASQTALRAFLPQINHFIQTEGGVGLRLFNAVECFRFKVLREAISKEDWFFAIMSQVYALTSNTEDRSTLFKETGISASLPGFQVLNELLEDNQRLCGRTLTYLAAFPVPIADAKQRLTFFPNFLEEVRNFLTDGYKIVGRMRDCYFKVGKVPTDEDLARDWNTRAPVFRYTVVRYLQHQVKLLLHAAQVSTLEHTNEQEHRQALQGQNIQMQQLQRNHQLQDQQLLQRLQAQTVQPQQQQQQRQQNPAPTEGVPIQNHNYQSQLANFQHRQMAINHQSSPQISPIPNYNTPQSNLQISATGGAIQPEQANVANALRVENGQPHVSALQRIATQGQRPSNPSAIRGNGAPTPLSIDTQRAQQLARSQPFQVGSVNNSPLPTYTPGWLTMPSSHMHSPIVTPTANQMPSGMVNRVPPSPGMQQQYNQSGLPSPAETQARRNSRAQLQGQSQRRVASTPAQQVATPPQQTINSPARRQSYVQGHPLESPDMTVLNSGHMRQVNDTSLITQPIQQTFPPQRPEFMSPTTMINALPSPRGVIPLPTPIRAYTQLPQNALQSHLMSPRFAEPIRPGGGTPPRSKLYISISDFAFPGVAINFKKSCQKITFNITEDTEKRLSKTRPGTKPGDGLTRPMVSPGSLIYRLRSIKWTKSTQPLTPDQEWVSQETDWPVNTFIEVNGYHVELRRKPAWGKDLPADITSFIRTGDNDMKIVVLTPRRTDKSVMYAMAVEIHECTHEDDITSSLHTIPPPVAKALITKRLIGQSADSDDLMVVDSDHLSLAVTCPLSFKLMNSPVRGRSCTHLECFDFKNFLESRPRRREWEPPNSDAWKCPICRGDARPGELVLDGFLVEVLNAIKEGDMGVQDPRNIVVKKDGSWEIKHEKENAVNEKNEDSSNTNGATGGNSKKEVEVICLDDDDE